MRVSWKLGRVAGIDLFLHPTFLIFLALVGMFEGGLDSVLLVSAVFGCVLLHELGHALMARRFGIATVDITLYPIGGVARLERLPRAPGAELLIALAGPAVNVAIALGLAVTGLAPELMIINLGLALFNMVPAFPMDGGRVLRALLSGWLGRGRATEVAAVIGQGLAVVFGLLSLSWGHWLGVFLAGFIFMAAGTELARVREEERRSFEPQWDQNLWAAPPGYRWVNRGQGVWQLAPIVVPAPEWPPSWR